MCAYFEVCLLLHALHQQFLCLLLRQLNKLRVLLGLQKYVILHFFHLFLGFLVLVGHLSRILKVHGSHLEAIPRQNVVLLHNFLYLLLD